ncbi:MAG: alpha-1,2-fucosyltransferase, partial [bacterium]
FQCAALKSLAIKYNRSFVIPPKEIFGTFYYQRLKSNIDQCFKIDCERGITNFPTIEERQFSFDEEFFNDFPSHDVNLLGFFQTEKYFKHIESQIKNDFSFIPEYY